MDKLFDTKRRYIGYDGDEYVNMCIPVVNLDKIDSNVIIRVNQDENGRIDNFVWRNIEKNMDMIDLTMYANHIFNPFSINDGDLLLSPVSKNDIYVSSNEPNLPDGTKFNDSIKGKKKMTYAEKVEYFARKGLGIK